MRRESVSLFRAAIKLSKSTRFSARSLLAMVRRRSAEEIQQGLSEATARACRIVRSITNYEGELSCTHTCTKTVPCTRDEILFTWSIGNGRVCDVRLRCDKALYGKPEALAPRPFLRSLSLVALAQPAKLQRYQSLVASDSDGDVVILSLAAPIPLYEEPTTKIVYIRGERIEHALCAHVSGGDWLCHPGTLVGNVVSRVEPFSPDDLILVDLAQREWTSESSPAKRLRGRVQFRNLKAVAEEHARRFGLVVALATYQAEALRAHREGREFNRMLAEKQMEEDPFAWAEDADDVLLLKWKAYDKQSEQWAYKVTPVSASDLIRSCCNSINVSNA